ncbi:tyrosine-protein phosphatase [Tepidibacter formicigenes]|jgi:protein-tyrosine phosphatase|uniref:protein-tyrosine-phosphatase n=1 Tax=Tepidibacter formicigenes DSM 15518 TaxID=1123349 RepID=A0A1M6TIT2_9FIRM|nr:CpsB/CapC family capsule biosynthesis tyrosine phosphatase [Tepidibacter formicigenes]SHK56813.1 protein-tyrosine phosphatase [Tepidibacter formicigenes DSM 15518]
MIDIHCHIVHNIDDGAKSLEESIEMAKIAHKDGIKKIINTSHYHLDSDFITGKELEKRILEFNNILKENGIDLEVLIGNELYYSRDLMNKIDELDFYSLNKSKYILIEFPPNNIPENMEDIIYEFKIRNYTPIIAHIERYYQVLKNPNLAYEYINSGALIQLNASSVTGKYGKEVKDICNTLLTYDMVHFIATDAHSSNRRRPILKDCYNYVENILGKEKADNIFYENPKIIIENKDIKIDNPKKYEEKGFKNIFKRIFKKSS